MEAEGSLPCSQEPSTGPYPEPDRPRPLQILVTGLRAISQYEPEVPATGHLGFPLSSSKY
jgi:hypothetical protein